MSLWSIFSTLGVILLVLISVAFFSLFERKVMASVQIRKGPNKVSISGILQPISDAMKLLTKVESYPVFSQEKVYNFAPLAVIVISLLVWGVFPVMYGWLVSGESILFLMLYFSISVYGIIFSGWGSNSRFATLGSARAICQSISYEIGLGLVLIFMCVFISTLSVIDLVKNQAYSSNSLLMFPLFLISMICFIAETNRTPFDLAEGESELVSGFNVEYGGGKYTMIFLGENLSILWIGVLTSLLFFQSSEVAIIMIIFLFVWIRATFPRSRYDKMMNLFWVVVFPLILSVGFGILFV